MCLEDPYKVDRERQWSYPLPEFGMKKIIIMNIFLIYTIFISIFF